MSEKFIEVVDKQRVRYLYKYLTQKRRGIHDRSVELATDGNEDSETAKFYEIELELVPGYLNKDDRDTNTQTHTELSRKEISRADLEAKYE